MKPFDWSWRTTTASVELLG